MRHFVYIAHQTRRQMLTKPSRALMHEINDCGEKQPETTIQNATDYRHTERDPHQHRHWHWQKQNGLMVW